MPTHLPAAFLPCQPEAGCWPPIIAQSLFFSLLLDLGYPSAHKPPPLPAAGPWAPIFAQGLSSLRWLLARMVQVLTLTFLPLLEAIPATPSTKWHLDFSASPFCSLTDTYASRLPVLLPLHNGCPPRWGFMFP